MHDAIRIVSRPDGEAPEWVRDAWIGLTLPLFRSSRPKTARGVGVLTGPRTFWRAVWASVDPTLPRVTGYLVKVMPAIAVLEDGNAEAADWWKTHAPQLVNRWGVFIFNEPCAVLA